MVFDLGLDGLVRFAGTRSSLMDLVDMALELVFATEVDVMVFAFDKWAFQVFGLDAMLGRGVAQEVFPALSDAFATGLRASPLSRLAVMISASTPSLMLEELPKVGTF